MVHGALAIPGKTDGDDVVITTDQIARAASTTSRWVTGTPRSRARAGGVTYAYAGAPEPVALDQDRAGNVLLVTLDAADGTKTVTVEERQVGRTRFEQLRIDAAAIGSQPALIDGWPSGPTPTSCSTSGSSGVRTDELDLHLDEIERALEPVVPQGPRSRHFDFRH